jgi:hypothetical protein
MWSKVNVSVLDHYQLCWNTNSSRVHGTDRYRPSFLSIRTAYWTWILNWHPSGLKAHPALARASGSLSFKVFQLGASGLFMRLLDIDDTHWIIVLNQYYSSLKALPDIARASSLLRLQQLELIRSHISVMYWFMLRSACSLKIVKINYPNWLKSCS